MTASTVESAPMADGVVSTVVRLDGTCDLDRAAIGGKAFSVASTSSSGRPAAVSAVTSARCWSRSAAARP